MRIIKKIHPLAKFFISLSLLIPVFISTNPYPSLVFLFLSTIIVLLSKSTKLYKLLLVFLVLLPFSISIFLLNALYGKYTDGETINFLSFTFYKRNLYNGLALGIRSFTLGVISISWAMIIDFSVMVKGVMQSFKLNPKIGYSLFVGINAIPHIAEEFKRIQDVRRIRELRRPMPLAVTLNILIQAVRFSEQASLSMTARNLGSERSYYRDNRLTNFDYRMVLFFYILSLAIAILLAINGLFKVGI